MHNSKVVVDNVNISNVIRCPLLDTVLGYSVPLLDAVLCHLMPPVGHGLGLL